jgi:predicted component of type VI protein secretion system
VKLVINPGTPQAVEFSLHSGVNRLGRAEDNDIVIAHGSVSGSHCEIIVNESAVMLRDDGSTNGSFVCGMKVAETPLQPGKPIRFGQIEAQLLAPVFVVAPAPSDANAPVRILAAPSPAVIPPPSIRINKPLPNIAGPATPAPESPQLAMMAAPPAVPAAVLGHSPSRRVTWEPSIAETIERFLPTSIAITAKNPTAISA